MRTELTIFQKLREKVQSFYNILKLDRFENKLGRKLALPIVEVLTIALFKQKVQIETKQAVYDLLELKTHCSYKTLVVNMNRFAHLAETLLQLILRVNQSNSYTIKHTDSTDIPVALNKNAKHHATMKEYSSWYHNGKGYYYGLKLTLTTDFNRKLLAIKFTTANASDRDIFRQLNDKLYGLFVADAGYISKDLEEDFQIEGKRYVIIRPKKNQKKLATAFELWVYSTRMLIEINFRNLKLFYGLITSLPRSVTGYLANYTYSLLAYALS